MNSSLPRKLVCAQRIRHMFNTLGYLEKIQQGALVPDAKPRKDRPAPSHQPSGTRSQSVPYRDPVTQEKIVLVHQYALRGGGLGASQLPDPKVLIHEHVEYFCHNDGCECIDRD